MDVLRGTKATPRDISTLQAQPALDCITYSSHPEEDVSVVAVAPQGICDVGGVALAQLATGV